ncbi:MAG: DUF3106 domain-containing protein [Puniceicoccales bacterium]
MKPTALTSLLRVALLALAPLSISSPALLAADDSAAPHSDMAPPAAPAPEAEPGPPPPPPPQDELDDARQSHDRISPREHRPKGMSEELAAVEKFLDMSPEQLAMIRNLIGRIEQMSEEEKEEMRARIRKIRDMDSARRQQLMEEHRKIPWEERMILHQYWRSLPDEERKALWREMKGLSPEERLAQHQKMLLKAKEAGFDESTLPPRPERGSFDRDRQKDGTNRENPGQNSPAPGNDQQLPPPPGPQADQ